MNVTIDLTSVVQSLGLPFRSLAIVRTVLRIAARIVPAVLDVVEGKTSSDPTAIAAGILGGLSKDGLEPVSARTFELFSVALVSLALDLQSQEPIDAAAGVGDEAGVEAGAGVEESKVRSGEREVVVCATCSQKNRVLVRYRIEARCGVCGNRIDAPDVLGLLKKRIGNEPTAGARHG
jgi:hypothetical protein